MKRIYIAISILIILPMIIAGSQFYLKGTTDKMTELIVQAENSAKQKDTDKAKKALTEFSKEWEINNKIIATFVRHSELDSVNESDAKLLPYLESEDLSSFYAECETVKAQFHHIMHTEEFSIDNIF